MPTSDILGGELLAAVPQWWAGACEGALGWDCQGTIGRVQFLPSYSLQFPLIMSPGPAPPLFAYPSINLLTSIITTCVSISAQRMYFRSFKFQMAGSGVAGKNCCDNRMMIHGILSGGSSISINVLGDPISVGGSWKVTINKVACGELHCEWNV